MVEREMEFAEQIVIVQCGTGWRSHCVRLTERVERGRSDMVKGMTGDSRDLLRESTGRYEEQLEGIRK